MSELDTLTRDVNQINERAAKRASADADLARFDAMDAALAAAPDEETRVRAMEDLLRHIRGMSGHVLSQETRARLARRDAELRTLVQAAQQRAAEQNDLYMRLGQPYQRGGVGGAGHRARRRPPLRRAGCGPTGRQGLAGPE